MKPVATVAGSKSYNWKVICQSQVAVVDSHFWKSWLISQIPPKCCVVFLLMSIYFVSDFIAISLILT